MTLDLGDYFSKSLFSIDKRKANQVFVTTPQIADGPLKPFLVRNAKRTLLIRDAKTLEARCRELARAAGGAMFDRFNEAVALLFRSFAVELSGGPGSPSLSATVTLASNQNKSSISESAENVVYIIEDDVPASLFGRFFQYYSDVPQAKQPLFIIQTEGTAHNLLSRLNRCPPGFIFEEVTPHATLQEYTIENVGCANFRDFVADYTNAVFSTVASTPRPRLDQFDFSEQPLLHELSARLFHLRSKVLELGKFDSVEDATALERFLIEQQSTHLTGSDATVLLLFRALNNLFLLYAKERSRGLLDNSMAIACALGDPLLQAHCLRYINLIEQPGPFAEFCLRGAAERFTVAECYDHANYCVNNLLVGRFYSDQPSADDFERLIGESSELIPNFRGVGIIYNNAGVAHLIEGRPEEARRLFDRGLQKPNMPLHAVGLKVNRMIAEWLAGGQPSESAIIQAAEQASRQIDPRYRYQLASIYLNLLRLSGDGQSDAAQFLFARLNDSGLLEDPQVTGDTHSLYAILCHLKLAAGSGGAHPGLRGRFISRHALVPIIHYTWL